MFKKYFPLVLKLIVAGIVFQTLYFKFKPHPDSVYIFSKIGLEPIGRIGTGILEGIGGILLLIPRTSWAGAALFIGLMLGAIGLHLTSLGIVVNDDGGTLFSLALIVCIGAAIILRFEWKNIPFIHKNR